MAEVIMSIESIAYSCGVRESLLDRAVTSEKFSAISDYLSEWKRLAPLQNISSTEVGDIQNDNQGGERQRNAFLERWNKKMGEAATYRALMKALLGIKSVGDATGVCRVLKAMDTAERSFDPNPIRELTVCNICKDTYTNPKMLQCQHVYCQQCLEELVSKDQTLTCLECGKVTAVPASRVADLPTSIQTIRLLNLLTDLKAEGAGQPIPTHITRPPAAEREYFCEEHDEKKVDLYCQTCDKLICNGCALNGGSHRDHHYECLDRAAEKHKLEMTGSLWPIKKCFSKNKDTLARLKGRREEITKEQTAVEVELRETFKKCHENLNTRETELLDRLRQLTREKLEKVGKLRDQLETTQARLSSCLADMASLEKECHEEVLKNKTKLAKQVKETESMPPPDQLEPKTKVTFSHHHVNLAEYCQNYMQISETEIEARVEGRSDHRDPACSKPTSQEERWEVFEIGNSPQTAAITSTPWDMAINQRRGGVMITEIGAEHVTVFSPRGGRLQSFGKYGTGRGEFQFPSAVEVDGVGNILVADCYNHRIQHFTSEGKFIREAGGYDKRPLPLKYPSGIAFNRKNNKIYVTDSQNILVLKSDLTLDTSFPRRSSGEGYRPCGIACDSEGNIYIPDYDRHHIEVFTAENEHVKTIKELGGEQGQLNSPSHVAIDSYDNVYVREKNHRVSVFTPKHAFVTSFNSPEHRPKEFLCYPRKDSNGVWYVCDWVNSYVQVLNQV